MKITNSGHAISQAVKCGHFSRDQAVTVRQIVRLAKAEEEHSMTPMCEDNNLLRLREKKADIARLLEKEIGHITTAKGADK